MKNICKCFHPPLFCAKSWVSFQFTGEKRRRARWCHKHHNEKVNKSRWGRKEEGGNREKIMESFEEIIFQICCIVYVLSHLFLPVLTFLNVTHVLVFVCNSVAFLVEVKICQPLPAATGSILFWLLHVRSNNEVMLSVFVVCLCFSSMDNPK